MRSIALCFACLLVQAATAFAQGPPPNGTPEQFFDAGMDAISGTSGMRNDLAAVDFFCRSAQKKYGPAQVVLGYLYDMGVIESRDPSQAADWYRNAADAGDPLVQWLLGRLYVTASGLPRDEAEAQKWLMRSAAQKNPFAAPSQLMDAQGGMGNSCRYPHRHHPKFRNSAGSTETRETPQCV